MGSKEKRKRQEEATSQPTKKVATQPASLPARPSKPSQTSQAAQPPLPTTIRVASVQIGNSCPPVLATHPGLCIPQDVKFQAYAKPNPKQQGSKHATSNAAELHLHSSSHSKIDYTAKEEGPGGRESHLKHYIGVFDPANGQLSVVEAKKMTIRGLVRSQQPPEEDMQSNSKSMLEQRTDLGHAFGTKKAKKALAAVTENAISNPDSKSQKLDASSKAILASINEVTSTMASREELQAAVDASKPRPPGNFEAEEIQDVYTLEGLIGGETLNAIPIKDWQDIIKKNAATHLTSAFVASRLQPVGEGPNSSARLRALRYLDCLIKFAKAMVRPGKPRKIPPADKLRELLQPAPDPVVQSIRRKFSSDQFLDSFHRDFLYTHCCVLAAILSNYQFDTRPIRHDLGLDEKQFSNYFREIGGKITTKAEKGAKSQIAILALPLVFPQMRVRSAKRR
ncbi:RNA polymerase I associated factor, A49-like protein [Xylariaceae sp. FL1272]|nr:RNA polymerase I associated factor, A49-like protein [Xylariaceae sp. FL1272]